MRWNKHYENENRHAFLGASKHHWINYDLEKMKSIWTNQFASQEGTRKHKLAAFCIQERVKLQGRNTLAMYVNDAIGFRMRPEQMLMYSENCFGTPDAIKFEEKTRVLRVHDLKTGKHPGSFYQLMIYCALFCAEYGKNPYDLVMILRIYQNNEVFEIQAEPEKIEEIMLKMAEFDPVIEEMKAVMVP